MKKIKKIALECMSFLFGLVLVIVTVAFSQTLLGVASLIFGFTYDSLWSILIFFSICRFVGFPLENFAANVPRKLLARGKLSLSKARSLFVVLDTIMSTITYGLVVNVMRSVSATPLSIVLFSFVLALLSDEKEIPAPLFIEEEPESTE